MPRFESDQVLFGQLASGWWRTRGNSPRSMPDQPRKGRMITKRVKCRLSQSPGHHGFCPAILSCFSAFSWFRTLSSNACHGRGWLALDRCRHHLVTGIREFGGRVHDRTNFHAGLPCRKLRDELQRLVQIPGLNDRESTQALLGLGEWAVGYGQPPLPPAHCLGGANRLKAHGNDVMPALPNPFIPSGGILALRHDLGHVCLGRSRTLIVVNQASEFHGFLLIFVVETFAVVRWHGPGSTITYCPGPTGLHQAVERDSENRHFAELCLFTESRRV